MSDLRFGPYRAGEILATGAASIVYRAVHEGLGRTVVIKTLKPSLSPTSSFAGQLDREAAVLADFAHPNVVVLIDLGRADGRSYLVLEHVAGPSLQQLLAKKRKLGVESALAIALCICAGLAHVHQHGVVHRDVAPSNVLLARTGVVKLTDFGIAQRPRTASVSDTLGTEGITPSGRLVADSKRETFGTPAYMSPEQILGDFVDARSDLFSLGVILYQMLSGVRPFESGSGSIRPPRGVAKDAVTPLERTSRPPPAPEPRDSAQRIRRERPVPLRQRAPEVPRAVERLVMRLLEKSPEDRFSSATSLLEHLEVELRSRTREAPAVLVREALVEAGLLRGEKVSHSELDARRPRITTARSMAGFVAFGALFGLGVLGIELASPSAAREGTLAGSAPLPLLPQKAGGLRVVATPWAHVAIDGEHVDTTPFARTIALSEGRHFITFSHPEAPPVRRDIDVVEGQVVTLDVSMTLAPEGDSAALPEEDRVSTDGAAR